MSVREGHANQRKAEQELLDIPSAAYLAGFTSRQFQQIIKEDRIPLNRINGKVFIGSDDLEAWKETRGEARLQYALQQLDRWLKYATVVEPVEMDDDE